MAATRIHIQMVPDYKGVLAREPSVKLVIHSRVVRAAEIAKSTAPHRTGAYRDSIRATVDQLVATDFKAHWIEFGTIRNRAFRTLTNAAERVARVRVN